MPKKVTTQALQDITLLPKMIPSCPNGAMLEKLISPPETKFQVDIPVVRPMTRLHGLPVCISRDPPHILNNEQPKYPVCPRSFRPMHQAPGMCQVRNAADQDASPSDDLSSLWSQKSRSLDRANRSQYPDPTAVINDEYTATKSSTWRSSIQESSHSEKAHLFRAEETAEDPDTKKD
ncbi:unnamed protein product [Phytophthora fragariaefolia]|uniref:Unnamed protein product n=1 Tax=Phytophthora fragariaefolia TaxID=1490495 RepID=A0A9W6Y569_9STRA|nr:unnamed protein product [Phytophthora fragariaefolia]